MPSMQRLAGVHCEGCNTSCVLPAGAQPGVVSKSRKALYELSHTFQALAGGRSTSEFDTDIPKKDRSAYHQANGHSTPAADQDTRPVHTAAPSDLQMLTTGMHRSHHDKP